MHCPFDETLCVEQHKETEEWVCAKCGWSSLTGRAKLATSSKEELADVSDEVVGKEVKARKGK